LPKKKDLIYIYMSEYMDQILTSWLIGAPPGYVGYNEGGQLMEAV
jgi:ATP-dependent Clp protease ATP-binding subunit ClpA